MYSAQNQRIIRTAHGFTLRFHILDEQNQPWPPAIWGTMTIELLLKLDSAPTFTFATANVFKNPHTGLVEFNVPSTEGLRPNTIYQAQIMITTPRQRLLTVPFDFSVQAAV